MTRRGAAKEAYVIAAIAAALYLAARTTGAGWLVVLFCGLVAVLAIAIVWPALAVRRVRVTVDAPSDAVVGDQLPVTLHAARTGLGVRLLPIAPVGEMHGVVGEGSTRAEVCPDQRGVIREMTIEVSSAAPLGLVWWRNLVEVPLARPVDVAPRRPETSGPPMDGPALDGDATRIGGLDGDQIRTVRDYRPGDSLRLVHWPATARTGQIMVKEREHPQQPRCVIALDLTGSSTAGEAAAERAMGVVCDALEAGREVLLCTVEPGGPVTALVAGKLDTGRRLARAVPGRPDVPDGVSTVQMISATGLSW